MTRAHTMHTRGAFAYQFPRLAVSSVKPRGCFRGYSNANSRSNRCRSQRPEVPKAIQSDGRVASITPTKTKQLNAYCYLFLENGSRKRVDRGPSA